MAEVGSGPIVERLHILIVQVRDLERALGFYRDLLGTPLQVDPADPEWAEARFSDGTHFALHPLAPDATPSSGTVDIEFAVADVERAAERLRAAGVDVGQVWRAPWGAGVKVVDPDGYKITLFEPKKS